MISVIALTLFANACKGMDEQLKRTTDRSPRGIQRSNESLITEMLEKKNPIATIASFVAPSERQGVIRTLQSIHDEFKTDDTVGPPNFDNFCEKNRTARFELQGFPKTTLPGSSEDFQFDVNGKYYDCTLKLEEGYETKICEICRRGYDERLDIGAYSVHREVDCCYDYQYKFYKHEEQNLFLIDLQYKMKPAPGFTFSDLKIVKLPSKTEFMDTWRFPILMQGLMPVVFGKKLIIQYVEHGTNSMSTEYGPWRPMRRQRHLRYMDISRDQVTDIYPTRGTKLLKYNDEKKMDSTGWTQPVSSNPLVAYAWMGHCIDTEAEENARWLQSRDQTTCTEPSVQPDIMDDLWE